jgi:hypothetical protein
MFIIIYLHIHELQCLILPATTVKFTRETVRAGVTLFRLAVPGLAENRPSVLLGDRVLARMRGAQFEFHGFVHRVEQETILLSFGPHFGRVWHAGAEVDARFVFRRTTARRCHLAVSAVAQCPPALFFPNPSAIALSSAACIDQSGIQWRNRDLNAEQRSAVCAILRGAFAPAPFCVFGPPGTGKTSTLTEAVFQLLEHSSASAAPARLLVTASSNTAADLFVANLASVLTTGQIVRINSYQRRARDVSPTVLAYSVRSVDDGGEHFTIPEFDALLAFKVVVCTFSTAAALWQAGLERGCFTHILCDECGHAEEPECAIPLALFATESVRVVLAGDHMQLGPLVRSPLALAHGLGVSLLERIMQIYSCADQSLDESDRSGAAAGRVVTASAHMCMLVKNYRSHPYLLQLPSRLFYGGRLEACARADVLHSLLDWSGPHATRDHRLPLLFIGVRGADMREAASPSYFNAQEVEVVMRTLHQLLDHRRTRLADVGIITPYQKQKQKLRRAIELAHFPAHAGLASDLMVGSVDEFQGQERKVIIISTVRSDPDLLEFDQHHNLGFLTNPKRFNVAITRAQAFLIVIGNPHVLVRDACWRELVTHAVRDNCYVGCELPADLEARAEPLEQHVATAAVAGEQVDGSDESEIEEHVDMRVESLQRL